MGIIIAVISLFLLPIVRALSKIMLRAASYLLRPRPVVAMAAFETKSVPNSLAALARFSSIDHSPLSVEEMQFLHHGKRPRFRNYEKFRSPRKRASKLLHELNIEAVQQSKASKPKVWETHFRVGDAIEIEMVSDGGVKSDDTDLIRGVVIGITRRALDTTVLLRDVVFGEPIERRVPLHSPLLRSLKVLEENFIYKGKRKVKRAKLYFLRDRNPLLTRVTKA
jgi:large subunit ribosomal protein L19